MNLAPHIRPFHSSFVILGIAAVGVFVLMAGSSTAPAEGNTSVVCRVEEDWKLVLNEPGTEINAPQFHTAMSPFGNLQQQYAQVLWNYREAPDFLPGGLQLESWNGEEDVSQFDVGDTSLSEDAETITWTQRLETTPSSVQFKIVDGHSSSWGDFGGDQMTTTLNVALPSLATYATSVSKDNSGVSFGANRVNLLVITEVRFYGPDGLIHKDTTPVVIFSLDDGSQ